MKPTQARRGGLVQGCLIALGVLVVVVIAAAVVVAMNWRSWTAGATVAATQAMLNNSTLPQDQKARIMAEVNSLGDDIKAGRVSPSDLTRVYEEIAHSPLIPLAAIEAARQKFIEPAGMTPEEKVAAERSLERFARGVYEGKITPAEDEITDTIKPVVKLNAGNTWEFKDNPTRQEVDQLVANAKAKADAAGVPDEPYRLSIPDELHKAIARALGRATEAPPAPAPAATPPGGP
ncbi:MAG: hypothetical protein IT437_02345 [Phycisphaerales bacterium]|nr:hypothetical protein [Phycisphaerales bacterium]